MTKEIVTRDQLAAVDFEEMFKDSEQHTCFDYYGLMAKRLGEIGEGNEYFQGIKLILDICAMRLRESGDGDSFKPLFEGEGGGVLFSRRI
jgi:hypothetical protein